MKEDLTLNLQAAAEACRYAREQVLTSNTQFEIDPTATPQMIEIADAKVGATRQLIHNIISTENINSTRGQTRVYALIAVTFCCGNCQEFSDVAFEYLQRQASIIARQVSIEIFSIANGDHVFVVIGRDPTTDPNSPMTWNEETVICDAWAGEFYPAREITSKLHDYSEDRDNQTGRNYLIPYHPAFHELAVILSNRQISDTHLANRASSFEEGESVNQAHNQTTEPFLVNTNNSKNCSHSLCSSTNAIISAFHASTTCFNDNPQSSLIDSSTDSVTVIASGAALGHYPDNSQTITCHQDDPRLNAIDNVIGNMLFFKRVPEELPNYRLTLGVRN